MGQWFHDPRSISGVGISGRLKNLARKCDLNELGIVLELPKHRAPGSASYVTPWYCSALTCSIQSTTFPSSFP